jgi:HlyD family secretion protein
MFVPDSTSVSPIRRWPRRIAWIGAVVVLAAGAAWAALRPRANALPQFETSAADRGRITARVTATGTLSALVTVQVGSQVSGRIQLLNADYNTTVKKGELIAKIDPQLFKAALEQARANLIAAKGNAAKARAQAEDLKRQAERAQQLAQRNLIALADRDTAVANAAAAQAQVQASVGAEAQANAQLIQAQVNLAYTDIISPIDGIVISRSVDVGQTVAASLQAPTLFTIAEDLRRMQVDTNVAEADVGKLSAGMAATFTVDAYPGERFQGKVRQVRNAPQTVQNVVTYDAVIDVQNAELKLKPGMTANVTFVYLDREDVLRVPNAALRYRPPPELLASKGGHRSRPGPEPEGAGGAPRWGGVGSSATQRTSLRASGARERDVSDHKTVWVLRNGQLEPVKIRTGVSDGTYTEVAEVSNDSLQAGDAVITGAGTDAQNGAGRPGGPGFGRGRLF